MGSISKLLLQTVARESDAWKLLPEAELGESAGGMQSDEERAEVRREFDKLLSAAKEAGSVAAQGAQSA